MRKFHNNTGESTPWISRNPTRKELEKLNINQLLIIVFHNKSGFKKIIIDFLLSKPNLFF